ncbi:MAG: hypothetical protein ACKERG_02740 [Candidatus Hodgkinia cicadicola]
MGRYDDDVRVGWGRERKRARGTKKRKNIGVQGVSAGYKSGMWVLAARRRATRCRLLLVFNRSPPALLPLSSRSPHN